MTHLLRNAMWMLMHPLLAYGYHRLKGCREGDYVYRDFTCSTEFKPEKFPIGFVGYVNHDEDCYAGNRIFIVGIDRYEQKVDWDGALRDCEQYGVVGTGKRNWHIGNCMQLMKLAENYEKIAGRLKMFTESEILENMLWSSTKDSEGIYVAVRIKDKMYYTYSKKRKTYFLRLLIL